MLENFSFRTIVEYLPLFGQGLVATVWLSVVSFAGALAVGIVALRHEPAARAAVLQCPGEGLYRRGPRDALAGAALFSLFRPAPARHRPAGTRRRHPCFVAEQRRLHRRDHPGRHPVDPARPGRGRRRLGHDLCPAHAPRHPAAGLQGDDPAAARAGDRAGEGFRAAVADLGRGADARRTASRLGPVHAGRRFHHHRRPAISCFITASRDLRRCPSAGSACGRRGAAHDLATAPKPRRQLSAGAARPRHDRHAVADQPCAGHADRLRPRRAADRRQPADQHA